MSKMEYVWLSNVDISNENKKKLMEKFGGVKGLFSCSLDDLVYFRSFRGSLS
ncbi:MAG: hypothetical protein IJ867_07230 [Clostridia bacterium]|nr:hypothetical protein [Clostridia bacterium]